MTKEKGMSKKQWTDIEKLQRLQDEAKAYKIYIGEVVKFIKGKHEGKTGTIKKMLVLGWKVKFGILLTNRDADDIFGWVHCGLHDFEFQNPALKKVRVKRIGVGALWEARKKFITEARAISKAMHQIIQEVKKGKVETELPRDTVSAKDFTEEFVKLAAVKK